jgi:hypothetical protein
MNENEPRCFARYIHVLPGMIQSHRLGGAMGTARSLCGRIGRSIFELPLMCIHQYYNCSDIIPNAWMNTYSYILSSISRFRSDPNPNPVCWTSLHLEAVFPSILWEAMLARRKLVVLTFRYFDVLRLPTKICCSLNVTFPFETYLRWQPTIHCHVARIREEVARVSGDAKSSTYVNRIRKVTPMDENEVLSTWEDPYASRATLIPIDNTAYSRVRINDVVLP